MNLFRVNLVSLLAVSFVFVQTEPRALAELLTYFGQDESKVDLTNSMQAQASFLAGLESYGTDTLEAHAGLADPTLTFGATGLTGQTDFDQAFSYALLAVSGSVALLDDGPESEDGPAFNDSIAISSPVTAFGSFFAQSGDGPANSLALRLENTLLGTSKDVAIGTLGPTEPFYNIFFFGVTDTDPFNRVTLLESYDYDGILLDDITVGHVVVPEPGSLTLLVCGAGIAWFVRRWRRRSNRW